MKMEDNEIIKAVTTFASITGSLFKNFLFISRSTSTGSEMNLLISFFVYFLSFLLLSFLFIYVLFMYMLYGYWNRRGVDTLQPKFPYGNLETLFRGIKSINICMWDIYKQAKGPFTGIYLLYKPALIIKDPELIKQIIIKDFDSFQDRGMYCDENREPLSGHLFRLSGERWRFMRSKLSPTFTPGKLKNMFDTMVETAKQLENYLENISEKGECAVIKDYIMKYAADVIASTIFGIKVNSFENPENKFWEMVMTLFKFSYHRHVIFQFVMFNPGLIKALKLKTLYGKSNQQVFEMVKDVVSYREKNKISRSDFMQLLIQLKNKGEVDNNDDIKNVDTYGKESTSKDSLSIFEVSAQAYTMFFAGFDTSATTMGWTLYCLAKNPVYQQKVYEEINSCLDKYNGELTYDALQEMTYLDCCIYEALRLYPVLGLMNRVCVKEYNIPNSKHVIQKGTPIYISLLGLHRDPDNFPNPEKYDPDRFLPENRGNIKPFTFMPFGEGPRSCIGKKMGQLQSAVGLVMILRKHYVSMPENYDFDDMYVEPLTLSHIPKDPLKLKINKRSK